MNARIWGLKGILGLCEGGLGDRENGRLGGGVSGRGAVTLNLWLPIFIMLFGRFTLAYQVVAWLVWVPNLLVAHWITRNNRVVII